jgi:hypothetical protein
MHGARGDAPNGTGQRNYRYRKYAKDTAEMKRPISKCSDIQNEGNTRALTTERIIDTMTGYFS